MTAANSIFERLRTRLIKIVIPCFCLLLISGCQKKDEQSVADIKPTAADKKVGANELIHPENIGNQISFIEKKFSLTARSKSETGNTYEVEGCEVTLTADNRGNVASINAYVAAQKCSFETGFGNTKDLTIGKLMEVDKKNNRTSRILVNCVSSCGRTREPEVIYLSPGAAVNGFVATTFASQNVNGKYEWIEHVKSILKIDNLDDDEPINCTDKFDKLAVDYLKGGDISSITISASNSIYWNEYPAICKN